MRMGRKVVVLAVLGVAFPLLLYVMSYLSKGLPAASSKGRKLILKGDHRVMGWNNTLLSLGDRDLPTTPGPESRLAEHVRRACLRQGLGARPGKMHLNSYKHILVDDRYKMLYCYVPKVACTNWRRVMLVLSGKVKVSNLADIKASEAHDRYKSLIPNLSHYSNSEIQYRLDNYYKFMFVREPFERLLSAWRNKFENKYNYSNFFRKHYGVDIVRRFGRPSEGKEVSERQRKGIASLGEFLRYLVDTEHKTMNEHWEKYHRLCHPCWVQYDFIGKYETLEEDAAHVLKAVHADHIISFPRRSDFYKSNRTASYVGSYYEGLSAALLRSVYRTFRADFELFDYAVPEDLRWIFE